MKKIILISFFIFLSVQQIYSQKIRVLTNQIGYDPLGIKTAVIEGFPGDKIINCSIKSFDNDEKAAQLEPVEIGRIDQWKNWYFWTIDFSSLNKEGKFYIECETNKGIVHSFPFLIQKNILERHTISDVVSYFKEQRCVGQNEKADRKMTFEEGKNDTIDVHGGWQDATGDYGKHLSHLSFSNYFIPQQIPMVVYSLCKSYEMLNKRNDDNFKQIKKRMVDELLYGADYLVRIKDPDGSFYRSISAPGPGKKPEDRRISPAMTGFGIKKSKNDKIAPGDVAIPGNKNLNYEVSFRGGGGIAIASLAMASQLNLSGDFSSEEYLKTAEDAFKF